MRPLVRMRFDSIEIPSKKRNSSNNYGSLLSEIHQIEQANVPFQYPKELTCARDRDEEQKALAENLQSSINLDERCIESQALYTE